MARLFIDVLIDLRYKYIDVIGGIDILEYQHFDVHVLHIEVWIFDVTILCFGEQIKTLMH